MKGNYIKYFDNFGVQNISEEIEKFIGSIYVITNIYRIQAYDLIICAYFLLDLSIAIKFARLYKFILS